MPRPNPYPLHQKALGRALIDLKDGVQEIPLGSNTGPRVRQMQATTWLGGTGWPWCVAAYLTWAVEGGLKMPWRGAGAYAFLDWAHKAGWAVTAAQAMPGDAVIFNIGSGHCAMLASEVTGETVHTVDGNSSDRVKQNWRPKREVRGFIHAREVFMRETAKPPVFEVIGSESGHKMIYVSGARAVGKKLPEILRKHPLGVTVKPRK